MIKVLHAADFHLDSPFRGLTGEQSAQRRREQRELLDRMAGLAAEEGVQLVLLAGDLFDSGEIYRETAQALAASLGRMGCPVFIAPGNHDCYDRRSPYRTVEWPDNVIIFTENRIQSMELPHLNCVVHGAAFTSPSREDQPLTDFRAPADGKVHLMVLHGEVANVSRYGAIPEGHIADSGLHYLALGHIHAGTGLRRSGPVSWAYPGCPEGRGFDETGEKGVLLGTVGLEGASMGFVPLCRRRYEILEADITQTDPLSAARAALAGHEQDICRVVFTGTLEGAAPDLRALERELAGSCWQLSLRDRTSLRRDLWARAEEDTLTGLFLRELRAELARAATQEERDKLMLAAKFGLAALENGEDVRP